MPNMTPVSPYELAQIQAAAVAAVCDKPCAILRKDAPARDIYGNQTQTNYVQIAETVVGVGQPTSTHLQNFGFMIAAEASYLARLPVGTDVQHQDRLVIDGQILEVHVILTPKSYPALLEAICAEIK